jgi:alcohol dehydrogenase (cytochrome c)
VNWASHVDSETGRPVETDIAKSIRAGKATEHWPSTRGGKNWQHAAFNPETGLLYANTFHEGRMYKHLEIKPHVVGQRYQFIENLPLPRAADQPVGHMEAIDPLTAQKKWRTPLIDFQIWSAMLATGGGLLFTGKETGEFIAVDADTGEIVWQFQTGSGINAMPVTYTHRGRQYVTVLSGIGGLYWNIAREQLKDKVPQGGSVWTFALVPE